MESPAHPRFFLKLDAMLDWINVISLLSITGLMFIQVILRYVLRLPLMGVEELCGFPTVWLYLFASVKASSERNQLVARVLEIFCKQQRTILALRALAAFCSSGILMWLTYWGYDYLRYALRIQKETPSLYLPYIYAEATVFISMALMFLYTVLELWAMSTAFMATPQDTPAIKEGV